MKNKMKNIKKISFLTYVLLAVVFSSCEKLKYPNTPSKFRVIQVKPNLTEGTSIYLVQPIDRQNLMMNETRFVDSVGKFNAGDTVSFQNCQ